MFEERYSTITNKICELEKNEEEFGLFCYSTKKFKDLSFSTDDQPGKYQKEECMLICCIYCHQ